MPQSRRTWVFVGVTPREAAFCQCRRPAGSREGRNNLRAFVCQTLLRDTTIGTSISSLAIGPTCDCGGSPGKPRRVLCSLSAGIHCASQVIRGCRALPSKKVSGKPWLGAYWLISGRPLGKNRSHRSGIDAPSLDSSTQRTRTRTNGRIAINNLMRLSGSSRLTAHGERRYEPTLPQSACNGRTSGKLALWWANDFRSQQALA